MSDELNIVHLPEHGGPLHDGLPEGPLLARILEWIVTTVAVVSHLTWIVLICVILANVVMRYVVGNSIVGLEELQWHLYAVAFMMGLSYCLVVDEHVRVDILAEGWRIRTRAWIEIAAMVLLVVPFALVILRDAIPFVEFSIRLNEVSRSPGGLPYRWVLKAFLPFSMGLLAMAAIARAIRVFYFLKQTR